MAGKQDAGTPERPSVRIARLMKDLKDLQPGAATDDRFHDFCARAIAIPIAQRPPALASAIAQAFGKTLTEVGRLIRIHEDRKDFEYLVPKSGWLREYIDWTSQTESPAVFHFFVGAVTIGAKIGRRLYLDKGAYSVFPNFCVMIIAPSGRCRKTTAANLGTALFTSAGGKLLADKTTPEALIDALQGEDATGLIYAQELTVFLGKQKYQEGMIPLLTALFDCPKEWTAKTIGRGATTLMNVGLSAIMCTTLDWLQTGVPADAFGGGFMSRFLFVVQEDTPRCFSLPPPLNRDMRKHLIARLAKYGTLRGAVTLDPAAYAWYDSWYRGRQRDGRPGERQFAGYYERKPDHLLRLAMVLRVSQDADPLVLTTAELVHALRILDWAETWLPATFDQLSSSSVGEDQGRLIRQLRHHGGALDHSSLLRKNSGRLNAQQFRSAIGTLCEAGLVEYDKKTRTYLLTPEAWR